MQPHDLDAVEAIASLVHPRLFEERAVFAEKRNLAPEGCFVLKQGGQPCGYLFSHPWTLGDIPKLNALLGALPERPDTFYLHDMALLPSARGGGAGSRMLARIAEIAAEQAIPSLSLVAVNKSAPFWSRHGFQPLEPAQSAALEGYGGDALLMMRPLAPGWTSGRSAANPAG